VIGSESLNIDTAGGVLVDGPFWSCCTSSYSALDVPYLKKRETVAGV